MTVIAIFTSSFLVGLSGALMPGPLTALTLERSAGWSRRDGPLAGLAAAAWVSTGHAAAELAMVMALLVGLGGLLSRPAVAGVIGLAGGAVLVWMGWGMASGAPAAGVDLEGTGRKGEGSAVSTAVSGAVVSVSNPYWLLWWATVGASYLALWAAGSVVAVAAFFVGHVASDYVWQLLLAGVVGYGGRWLTPGVYRGLMIGLGVFLAGLGLFFVRSGAGFLGLL